MKTIISSCDLTMHCSSWRAFYLQFLIRPIVSYTVSLLFCWI